MANNTPNKIKLLQDLPIQTIGRTQQAAQPLIDPVPATFTGGTQPVQNLRQMLAAEQGTLAPTPVPQVAPQQPTQDLQIQTLQNILRGPQINFEQPFSGLKIQDGQIISAPGQVISPEVTNLGFSKIEEEFERERKKLVEAQNQRRASTRTALAKLGVARGASASEQLIRDLGQQEIRELDALNEEKSRRMRGVTSNIAARNAQIINDLTEQARQRIISGEESFKGQNELLLRFLEQQQSGQQAMLTPDIKEFMFAQEQGYQGDFLEFQKTQRGESNTNQIIEVIGEDQLPHKVLVDKASGNQIADLGVSSLGAQEGFQQETLTLDTPEGAKKYRVTFDNQGRMVSKVEIGEEVERMQANMTVIEDIVADDGTTHKVLFDKTTGNIIRDLGVSKRDGGDLETAFVEIFKGDGKHRVLVNKNTGEEIKDLGISDPNDIDGSGALMEAILNDPQIYNTLSSQDKVKLIPGLKDRGFEIPLSPANEVKARDAIATFNTADSLLDRIEEMGSRIITASTAGDIPRQYFTQNIDAIAKFNPDAAVYLGTVEAFTSLLARAAGEKGVLTDEDIKRIKKALPELTDTRASASGKMNQLRTLYESIKDGSITAFTQPIDSLLNKEVPGLGVTELDDFRTQFPDATPEELEELGNVLIGTVNIPSSSKLAFVNNNPGNLRFANQRGATKGSGGFARFETPEAGFEALKNQIRIDKNKTLEGFISKYAPPSENDTELYIQQIQRMTGADRKEKVKNINIDDLAKAMARKESSTVIV